MYVCELDLSLWVLICICANLIYIFCASWCVFGRTLFIFVSLAWYVYVRIWHICTSWCKFASLDVLPYRKSITLTLLAESVLIFIKQCKHKSHRTITEFKCILIPDWTYSCLAWLSKYKRADNIDNICGRLEQFRLIFRSPAFYRNLPHYNIIHGSRVSDFQSKFKGKVSTYKVRPLLNTAKHNVNSSLFFGTWTGSLNWLLTL